MRRITILLTNIIGLLSLSACQEIIYDFTPVEISFYILDKEGADLLNPNSENYIGEMITLTHNGESYTYSPSTKATIAVFSGLSIIKSSANNKYYASFGDFDGAKDMDDDFIITFPDGTTKTIHYDRKVHQIMRKYTGKVSSHFTVDGEKVKSMPVTIIY